MCILPDYLHQFRAFMPRGKESQIDKDSLRVLQIQHPDQIIQCIHHILIDTSVRRSISDTVLALCVATGRRTMEILATGVFEAIPGHEHILLFYGQVKCNGHMEAYRIPCLLPSSMIIEAHRRIRIQCNIQTPVSPTSQGDHVRYMLHQRFSSQLNKKCKKLFQEYITGKFHVHDLRGLYVFLAFHMSKHTNTTFPKFAQCALGHCSQHISLHYNRFRMYNTDTLPLLDFHEFPFLTLREPISEDLNVDTQDKIITRHV
jgi:integrase